MITDPQGMTIALSHRLPDGPADVLAERHTFEDLALEEVDDIPINRATPDEGPGKKHTGEGLCTGGTPGRSRGSQGGDLDSRDLAP
ncbi:MULTISPECIES: hypothetical protein [unclassified Streptomyces]|uniref:hypothetical protein n=1 Tax=unclassified Streptomyces TaxID=2593676 RepID=UPI0033AF6735